MRQHLFHLKAISGLFMHLQMPGRHDPPIPEARGSRTFFTAIDLMDEIPLHYML